MLNLDSDQRLAQWHMPEELRAGLLPREVRYTWRAWAVLIASGCIMAPFLALTVSACTMLAEDLRVRREGVAAHAVVTRHWASRGRRSVSHRVAYAYVVDKVRYSANATVSRATYEGIRVGADVPIHILPGSPDVSRMDDATDLSVVGLSFALPLLVFGALGWSVVRARRLIALGTPIAAVVTTVPSKRGKPMRYQYEPSPGNVISASAGVLPGTVHEGDIITVLYDPGRPRRSVVYPSGLVRLNGQSR